MNEYLIYTRSDIWIYLTFALLFIIVYWNTETGLKENCALAEDLREAVQMGWCNTKSGGVYRDLGGDKLELENKLTKQEPFHSTGKQSD